MCWCVVLFYWFCVGIVIIGPTPHPYTKIQTKQNKQNDDRRADLDAAYVLMQAQGVATAHTGAEFDYPEDYHMQMPDAKRARVGGEAEGEEAAAAAYPDTDGQYAGVGEQGTAAAAAAAEAAAAAGGEGEGGEGGGGKAVRDGDGGEGDDDA